MNPTHLLDLSRLQFATTAMYRFELDADKEASKRPADERNLP